MYLSDLLQALGTYSQAWEEELNLLEQDPAYSSQGANALKILCAINLRNARDAVDILRLRHNKIKQSALILDAPKPPKPE